MDNEEIEQNDEVAPVSSSDDELVRVSDAGQELWDKELLDDFGHYLFQSANQVYEKILLQQIKVDSKTLKATADQVVDMYGPRFGISVERSPGSPSRLVFNDNRQQINADVDGMIERALGHIIKEESLGEVKIASAHEDGLSVVLPAEDGEFE